MRRPPADPQLLLLLVLVLLFPFLAAPSQNEEDELDVLMRRSPDGSRVLVHPPYDPYGHEPEPATFEFRDARTGDSLTVVESTDVGRFVSSIDWLDQRWVLVRGEGILYVILDSKQGKVESHFLGERLEASADRHGLAFIQPEMPLRGPRPPSPGPVRVAVAWLSKKDGDEGWRVRRVYPTVTGVSAPKRGQGEGRLISGFAWASGANKLAFVYARDSGAELVTVGLPSEKEKEPVVSRQRLPAEFPNVRELRWKSDQKSLVIETADGERLELRDPRLDVP